MQHVVSVESSPFLLIVHVLICDFAIYITIHFIFNMDWMANTEIVLDPNTIYKMVVLYLFTLMTPLITSTRVIMRTEQSTECFVPL